tara:strand:+ start:101 stop:307 length:207 start_codon:yes stop_codon:yes gene_type:complete
VVYEDRYSQCLVLVEAFTLIQIIIIIIMRVYRDKRSAYSSMYKYNIGVSEQNLKGKKRKKKDNFCIHS